MKKIYLILPIICGILSGSSGVFVRGLSENGIDPMTLLFLRFSIGILVLLIAIVLYDKSLLKIKLKDFKLFIIPAICIIGINISYNEAMKNIPLSLAAVLLSSAPIFVIILAYIVFGEKISSKKVISIIFVILGCILTSGLLEGNVFDIDVIGIAEGIGAALFIAIYTITSKRYLDEGFHIYTVLLYSITIISILLIPFTDFGQINLYVNSNIAFNVLFLILHSTLSFALPYVLLTISLRYIDVGITSIYISGAEPLAALLFGMIMYEEIPTFLMIIGIILTILAITNILIKISSIRDIIPFDL